MAKRLWPVALLALVIGLSACSDALVDEEATDLAARVEHQKGDGMQTMGGPAPNNGTAQFEIRWMENMIDHHTMAIMMAEMCVEKAIHSELESLCNDIIAAQSEEVEMMQTWLEDWYGISYEPQMSPGEMQQMEQMAALEGEEFEIAFMEEMIQHHRMAIMEARMALRRAYHEELKTLARNIIATQSAEIEQMQGWLCEWYDRCKTMKMR